MKTRNIIILALTALFTVSCHTWDAPGEDSGLDSYGNPSLKETNVRTIAEVKEMFKNEISTNDLKKVEQSMQIKVVVVGNDEGGNIYKSLYVQDNTGALALSIDQSGLFGAFSTGQCVLIELKDLYVGGYEKQPQVGTLYFNENKGVDQVGRLTRYEWQRHYKLLNPVEGLSAKPIVTDKMSKLNLERDCGRLVTLVGVRMKDADGEKVFAPSDGSVTLLGGCANREITGMGDVVVRTSTYAKFANMPMPTEKLTITGVASRYRDGWQLMPRKLEDIQAYTGNEVLDDINDPTAVPASGSGTAADPFNIAAAIAKCQEVGETESTEKFYVKGIAVTEGVADATYGNATFKMADTAEGSALFTAYQVYGSDGKKLKSGYKVNVGDEVVVYGPVVNYKGNTPETTGKGTAIIVSVNGKKTDGTDAGETPTPTPSGEAILDVDFTQGIGSWTIDNKNKPAEVEAIWVQDAKYGMKATGFANSTNFDSEAWVISPKFSLSEKTAATLKISHAINFFTSVDVAKTQAVVLASSDGTNWTELTLSSWPDKLSWTFFDATADLSSFAGKGNVQIALKYLSTAEKAGTWEVKTIKVE